MHDEFIGSKKIMERKTPKNDAERLRLYNLPFELLRGQVYCKPDGCISKQGTKWRFLKTVHGKRTYETFLTKNDALSAQKSWVSQLPYERCGNMYVQYGDEILCRSRNGSKWWMSMSDRDMLEFITWRSDRLGYIRCQKKGKTIFMHRHILKRLGDLVSDRKVPVDHINHIRYDNRRNNLRASSRQQNALNCSYQSVSGRLGIHHTCDAFSFRSQCGKKRKSFSYIENNWTSAQMAWDAALDARIEFERTNVDIHENHTDYLLRKPLIKEYWIQMQQKVQAKGINTRKIRSKSGRTGISFVSTDYQLNVRMKKHQKTISYSRNNLVSAIEAWKTALDVICKWELLYPETKRTRPDYQMRPALNVKLWTSMQTVIEEKIIQRTRERPKRKTSPNTLEDRMSKK